VAVSPVTTSAVFLALFVVFVAAGTWLLMSRHLLGETESLTPPVPRPSVAAMGRDLLTLSLLASVATLAVTTVLFLFIPRIGQAALPLRTQAGRIVAGFTEKVELGAFGEIEADTSIVMRVHLKEWMGGAGRPEALPSLRWRGIAFDQFDGRTWTVSKSTARLTLRRQLPVPFPIHRYYGGPVLTQEVYLEPIGTEMVFATPRVLRLQGRSDFVTIDDLGNLLVPVPAARLHYTVESEPEVGDPRRANLADARQPVDPRWHARFTQLPPIPSRITELAREVTAGSGDRYEAARRLTAWLSRELTYTRVLERVTTLDPLEEFLFVRRSGNCEYFAAALAVMLRSLDIPARVVNGFQRGEWNPYGEYFIVRLRDAHSWVEVFVEGAGWVTLDPSPRGAVEPPGGGVAAALWLDALRLSWYRYVINWSLHDQLAAAEAVRRATWSWSAAALALPNVGRAPRLALAALAVAIALVAAAGWRRRSAAATADAVMPRFYARALRALARRGLAPAPGETAREFAGRANERLPASEPAVACVTSAYERVRFGAVALTWAEAELVDAALTTLEGGDMSSRQPGVS
jgi:transglutaminase-like putative cysteine protease